MTQKLWKPWSDTAMNIFYRFEFVYFFYFLERTYTFYMLLVISTFFAAKYIWDP